MKYCCRYSNKIKVENFDEVSILYDKQDRELVDYLSNHSYQKTTLIISDIHEFYESQEWIKLNAIKEKYPDFNFSVCFYSMRPFEEFTEELKECGNALVNIPFYTGYLAVNFDELNYLCQQGVSEVYVGEDLGFDLKRVKRVANQYSIQVRVFPNVAQSCIKSTPALKKFFIRPEDVAEYEDCIDTLEFWGTLNRQDILRKIYGRARWMGDLQDIILDFDIHFDSRRIVSEFGKMRKICGRKCMKGDYCKTCEQVYALSKKMEEKGVIVKNNDFH